MLTRTETLIDGLAKVDGVICLNQVYFRAIIQLNNNVRLLEPSDGRKMELHEELA